MRKIVFLLLITIAAVCGNAMIPGPPTQAAVTFKMPFDSSVHPLFTGGPHPQGYFDACDAVARSSLSGIDIALGANTDVLAVADGTIQEKGYQANGWGNYVVINQGGVTVGYAHLNSIESWVANGLPVQQGDIIGKSGNTGDTGGAYHLHLDIYQSWHGFQIDGYTVWAELEKANNNVGFAYTGTMTRGTVEQRDDPYPCPAGATIYFAGSVQTAPSWGCSQSSVPNCNQALTSTNSAHTHGGGGGGQAPVAEANGPYSGYVGQDITFTAAGSHDPDGSIVAYDWDWNNDGVYESSGYTASHSWSSPFTGQVTLRVKDNDGLTRTDTASVSIVGDTTPPQTTISLDPATPNGNPPWYVTGVTVSISAVDPGDYATGVDWTKFRLNGTGSWQIYNGPFPLGEGITLVEAYSADKAGNVEDPPVSRLVKIDWTPPVTTATLDPVSPNGERGWYNSDVTVHLNASDPALADGNPGSGVDSTQCRLNGGSWHDCRDPFPVTDEGWNQVDFYSTDVAGNVEATENVRFKIDKTKPDIGITEGILDGLHWDQVHIERGILTNTATLALSGNATDNLCLWEVRAVDGDSGNTLASQQPVGANTPDWPPPYPPNSLAYSLNVPLHTGINNIAFVAEDCAGWEKSVATQVVYVIPGPYDPRSKGFWSNGVKTGKYTSSQMQTLLSYVNVVSDTWGPATRNIYGLLTMQNYGALLDASGAVPENMEKAQLLAVWLNLVSGRMAVLTPVNMSSVKGWAQVVDNTSGSPKTFALNVPMQIEEVDQTRPPAKSPLYQIAKNLAEGMDIRSIVP